jgi:hypothetical protein
MAQLGTDGRPTLGPSALTFTTIRRSVALGWRYLAIGTVLALFLSLVLVLAAKSATVFATTFPLELPLFAVLGSSGGLITFVSDRTKGVFEYLIAYGIRPRSLFVDSLISTAALAALILGFGLGVGLTVALSHGLPLTTDLAESLAYYTVPMGFAGALFTATVGMIWSSVSTPRTGINSPIGIAPMIGIAPVILVLIVAEALPHGQFYYFTAGASVAIIVAVVGLLAMSARLMGRERFLSPL